MRSNVPIPCFIVFVHSVTVAFRRWFMCNYLLLKKKMLNGSLNRKQSLHSSLSSSNFAMKSFGTGRVYVKSHSCLAMTSGVIIVSLLFVIYGIWNNKITVLEGVNFRKTTQLQYGIMIDAGSTGSRVHVYKFIDTPGDAPPLLENEVFEQVKPGLSSFADHPLKGVKSIESLLDIAKRNIPKEKWSETPVALKATAGLRLLPGEQAKVLLEKVDELIDESPFKVPKDPVMIMDGKDEGIYAWLTVNYLLNLIGKNTVGTIDLGGGSMQITFEPEETETIKVAPKGYIQDTEVFNNKLQVYVHSYLGLGLMSARELILSRSGPPSSVTIEVTSPCMPEGYSGEWLNAQKKYIIRGSQLGKGKFDSCREIAKSRIAGMIDRPDELNHETFYAFSYYFDRAAETGLIHPEEGGIVSVGKYEDTAREVCSKINHRTDMPFMCMDLSIISSFLRDGFGFSRDVLLNIRKKIEGKENSWALGGTFFLIGDK